MYVRLTPWPKQHHDCVTSPPNDVTTDWRHHGVTSWLSDVISWSGSNVLIDMFEYCLSLTSFLLVNHCLVLLLVTHSTCYSSLRGWQLICLSNKMSCLLHWLYQTDEMRRQWMDCCIQLEEKKLMLLSDILTSFIYVDRRKYSDVWMYSAAVD